MSFHRRENCPPAWGHRLKPGSLPWALSGLRVTHATREHSLHCPVLRTRRPRAWKRARCYSVNLNDGYQERRCTVLATLYVYLHFFIIKTVYIKNTVTSF